MSAFEGGHRLHDQYPYHTRHGKRNQKGILKSFTGRKYGDHQVDQSYNLYPSSTVTSPNLHMQVDHLHETLDDANCTMSENERLLSNYQTRNVRQSMELEEVSCINTVANESLSCKNLGAVA